MNSYMAENEIIASCLKELKLPAIKDLLEDVIADATEQNWSFRKFLCTLLMREMEQRVENRKYQRIRKACFPQMKYLQELELEELPAEGRNLLPEFETLSFIKEGRNIVMYGNPGTGKTHIATGLGIKACMEGFTVYFTSVQRLLTQIREAKAQKMLQSLEYKFKKYDLVICDEMGYVSFDKEGAELLFSHLSLRSGSKATIITTNLPFTRWEEIMKDRVLCSALVDRLCHKAYLVNMTGKSYRIRETQNMFKKQEMLNELYTFAEPVQVVPFSNLKWGKFTLLHTYVGFIPEFLYDVEDLFPCYFRDPSPVVEYSVHGSD